MANLADLSIGVTADIDDLTAGMDEAIGSVEDLGGETSRIGSFVEDNFLKMGAAAAGIGAGLEGFARSQQDANYGFERMGRVTGEGADKMRDMATSLQNVTFPMEDVTALMETATQSGLEGDAIAEYATFWDMVGDATGEAGPELAKAGTALGLVGIKAGEEAEALDAFGYITDQTKGSVQDFLGFVERTASELGDATPTVDEMAGALGALEDAGFRGQRAQRELRTALSETDGDMIAALGTLGVSEDAFAAQVAAVEESSGAIQANADAYKNTFTPLEKMSAKLESVMTKYGGLADVAGAVAAPMAGVGSAMMGVAMVAPNLVSKIGTVIGSMGTWIATMATTVASTVAGWVTMAATSMVNAVKMAASWVVAMGPVGWVIAAVVALVALIVANWNTVKEWTEKIWDWVSSKVAAVWDAIVGFVTGYVSSVVSLVTGAWDTIQNATRAVWDWLSRKVKQAVDFVVMLFTNFTGPGLIIKHWDTIQAKTRAVWDWISSKVSAVVSAVTGTVSGFVSSIVGFFTDLKDRVTGIASTIKDKVTGFFGDMRDAALKKVALLIDDVIGIKDRIVDFFSDAGRWLIDAGKKIMQGLIDGLKSMATAPARIMGDVVGGIRDKLPFSPAKEGPLSGRGSPDIAAKLVQMIADGMGSQLGSLSSMAERTAMAAMPGLSTSGMPDVGVPRVGRIGPAGSSSASGGGWDRVQLVLDRRVLTEVVRSELERTSRRNGG